MKEFFSISEAATATQTTAETLRHYDRIGLVQPGKKDQWTKYRYYSREDLVRIHTVRALQRMDLPLKEIRAVLDCGDLETIAAFFAEAERRADEKIAAIQFSKEKIRAARQSYEQKLQAGRAAKAPTVVSLPERVIFLSDTLETPTLENLWNYLRHFYEKIPEDQREQYAFEDTAGIYTENGRSKLFAVCLRYPDPTGLKTLPAGRYLCAVCTETEREKTTEKLLELAETEYHTAPDFTVEQILVSGILQWKYQIQIYLGS